MNNEIIFPTDLPTKTTLSDSDILLMATSDGAIGSLPGRAINKVAPIASTDEITAIRIETADGRQHSATIDQLQSLFTGKLDAVNDGAASADAIARMYAQDADGEAIMATPAQVAAAITPSLAKESDLPVIPALAEIDHIRVIDKSGASYRATPAQMREMVGIDHSILTEQIVPGEYWLGADGIRRQVYVRTFVGTTPTVFGHTGNTHLYCWVWSIGTGCSVNETSIVNGWVDRLDDGCIDYNTGEVAYNIFGWSSNGIGIVVNDHCKARYINKPYRLTIKYTKK